MSFLWFAIGVLIMITASLWYAGMTRAFQISLLILVISCSLTYLGDRSWNY